MNPKYDYTTAGFNGFLSRSTKSNPLAMTLNDQTGQGSGSTINLDRVQINGALGNLLSLGRITIDGINGRIVVSDENDVQTAWLGNLTP